MMKRIIIALIVSVFIMGVGSAKGEETMIEAGKKVKFDYSLTVNGEVVDSSEEKGPLEYVHGQEMIIPGLESKLAGLKIGDAKSITVAVEDAYGPVNPELFREFPKAMFGEGAVMEAGKIIQLQDKEGNAIPALIQEVKVDTLVLNFNHPLAGQELTFDVKIVAID